MTKNDNMLPETSEVKKMRKILGMTQTQLAKLSGVSQSLIAKIEANQVDPAYSNLKKIYTALSTAKAKNESNAEEIMHKGIISVKPKDTVRSAINRIKKHNISQMPVFSDGKNIGSVSEKLIVQCSEDEKINNPNSVLVEDMMDEPYAAIDCRTPSSVIKSMLKHYDAVLVKKKAKYVGIISRVDVLDESLF